MKNRIRIILIILPPLLFFIFVYLGGEKFRDGGKNPKMARQANIGLPVPGKVIKGHIEVVKQMDISGIRGLQIGGWVMNEHAQSEDREVYLVLKSKDQILIFEITEDSKPRPDVSKAYKITSGFDDYGFELTIPMDSLTDGLFQIGFVIQDKEAKVYTLFEKALQIENGQVSLIKTAKDFVSKQVDIPVRTFTSKVKLCFDKVDTDNNFFTLLGWGFIDLEDARALRSYIVLRQNDNDYYFDVEVRVRKDITRAFGKGKINLDSTGFFAKIPKNQMEKGIYQLGIYIEKNGHSGIVFDKKHNLKVGE